MRDLILQPGDIGYGARALHRLCLDAPPIGPKRPPNLRWMLWDLGHYAELRKAYAAGLAGQPLSWPYDTIFACAWLAGCDAAAAAQEAAA